jgi:hypothetical protein
VVPGQQHDVRRDRSAVGGGVGVNQWWRGVQQQQLRGARPAGRAGPSSSDPAAPGGAD